MQKYHDVSIIKGSGKIIAVVRGLCSHSNSWQEYYRQDVTESVLSKVNAPQNTMEEKQAHEPDSESTPRCEECGMPLRLECTTPYCDNSIVP